MANSSAVRRILKQPIAKNQHVLKITSTTTLQSLGFGASLISINIVNHSEEDVLVSIFQAFPSTIQPFFHTLSQRSGGEPSYLSVHPSKRKNQPAWLSADIAIPANNYETITIEVIAPLRRVYGYPSDPYKGIALPGCIIKLSADNSSMRSAPFPTIQGYHSWVTAPLPDFSMVYNVPVISATVVITALIPMLRMLLKPMRVTAIDK